MLFKEAIVVFGSLMLILSLLYHVTFPILVRFVRFVLDLDDPKLFGLDLFARCPGDHSIFSVVLDILTNSGVKKFAELYQTWKNLIFPLFRILLD